jgi:predicted ester cyclase
MSVEATSKTIRSYLDALLARGDFADSFTDDITWTTVGTGPELQGRQPIRDFISWMHTQAFDAHPKVKTLVVGDGQAALEADFVGTHTGEFLGMPATGKAVQVCPTVWSTTFGTTRSRPFVPTCPWNRSLNSSGDAIAAIGWQLVRGGYTLGAWIDLVAPPPGWLPALAALG